MKKYIVSLVILFSFGTVAWAAMDLNSALQFSPQENKSTRFLYIILSQAGKIELVDPKQQAFILTLKNVNPQIMYFANRPAKFSGQSDLETFLKQWRYGLFSKKPPTVLMEVVRLNALSQFGESASYTVILSAPVYAAKDNQLSFKMHPLPNNETKLPDLGYSDYITLFIDQVQQYPPASG